MVIQNGGGGGMAAELREAAAAAEAAAAGGDGEGDEDASKLSVAELWSVLSHGAEQIFDPTAGGAAEAAAQLAEGALDALLDEAKVGASSGRRARVGSCG